MANRTVYTYIRKVLGRHKALRREEVFHHIVKEFNYYEGDIGKRLREMMDVRCDQSKTRIKVNGRMIRPHLYSLTRARKAS